MTCQSYFGSQLRQLGRQTISFATAKAASDPRWRNLSRPSALAAAIFIMPAIAVAAAYFSRPAPTIESAVRLEGVSSVATPDVSAQIAQISEASTSIRRVARTVKDESFKQLLARLGVTDPKALEFITENKKDKLCQALQNLDPGLFVVAEVFSSDSLKSLSLYEEEKGSTGKLISLSRTAPNGNLTLSSRSFRFRISESVVNGKVDGPIDRSLSKAGLSTQLIRQIHGVFDRDRDPLLSMNKGDRFWIVYERKQADGYSVSMGKPLAIVLRRGQRTLGYYWFNDGTSGGGYYDAEGTNVKRAFLRIPLDVRAVSSGFNRMRKHPITGVVRPHLGTDLGAPKGSIVRAASDGVVRRTGWGTGYGNYILLDHGNGYETLYAHLSAISKEVKPGAHVKISQQIGRVGMTGLATGPHLHYELRLHKQQINPMTAKLPTVRNLSAYRKGRLKVAIGQLEKNFQLPTKNATVAAAQAKTQEDSKRAN